MKLDRRAFELKARMHKELLAAAEDPFQPGTARALAAPTDSPTGRLDLFDRARRVWLHAVQGVRVDQDIFHDNLEIAHVRRAVNEQVFRGIADEIQAERDQAFAAARIARRTLPPLSERLRTRGRR